MAHRLYKTEIVHSSYRECSICTLPYIENVNGRNGQCDFCAEGMPAGVVGHTEDLDGSAIRV